MDILNVETIFWYAAILGSVVFVIKTLMTMIAGSDLDFFDADLDGDIEADTEHAFKLLSITSVSAFFMTFGWGGLTALNDFELNTPLAVLFAFFSGVSGLLLVVVIFYFARKLQSEGANFNLEDTLGKKAKVYQEIPKSGQGKIQIEVADMMHEIEAISKNGEKIASFETIKVVEVVNKQTVAVEKYEE